MSNRLTKRMRLASCFVVFCLTTSADIFGQISQEQIDKVTPYFFDSSPTTQVNFVNGDRRISAIARKYGPKWGGPAGTGAVITYSFPKVGSVWSDPYEVRPDLSLDGYVRKLGEPFSGLKYLNETEKGKVRNAIKTWESVANITFIEVEESATRVGDIRFAKTDNTVRGVGMHSSGPTRTAASADIWINNGARYGLLDTLTARWDLLHEIGHSLGLSHPFEGPEEHRLPASEDHSGNTVMSYTSRDGGPMSYYIDTIPPYDRLAVTYLYGPKGAVDQPVQGSYSVTIQLKIPKIVLDTLFLKKWRSLRESDSFTMHAR